MTSLDGGDGADDPPDSDGEAPDGSDGEAPDGSDVGNDPDDAAGPPESSDGGDRSEGDEPNVPDPGEYLDRRTLVKILLALGFGIPIAIEGWTFLNLIRERLFGNGEDDGTDTTTTREPAGVGVGDELLASTPQTETVEDATIDPGEDGWTFSMTVVVANDADGDADYQFRILSVTGRDGTTVSGTVETRRLSPGESEEISGSWQLPDGERPGEVRVAATTFPRDGDPSTSVENVTLGNVPVRN